MDDSNKGWYDIILGWDVLLDLGFKIKWSEHSIKADGGHLKGFTAPMVDLGMYEIKD